MSLSMEEFTTRLTKRMDLASNRQKYPPEAQRLRELNWRDAKKNVVAAVNEVVEAADRADPRPGWDVLCEKIRQTGQDLKSLKALARDPVGMVTKPALDEALGGHSFERHFGATDDQQEDRIVIEGKPRVTSVVSEGEDGRAYLLYTTYLAKKLPGVLKAHIKDICELVVGGLDEGDKPFNELNVGQQRARVRAIINGQDLTHDDDEFTILYKWQVPNPDNNQVTLRCDPEVTSTAEFAKEITERGQDGEIGKTPAMKPLQAFFGSKKFVIEGLNSDSRPKDVNLKVEGLNYQNIGVTNF